ncbi:hypothetical protein F5882DRAFT_411738 [Hyaloscypha sp. PMI_1271]|nr:hypothetical protein F5882DRAFT_411738 [Hyaloscypha sp. PMI_1271]
MIPVVLGSARDLFCVSFVLGGLSQPYKRGGLSEPLNSRPGGPSLHFARNYRKVTSFILGKLHGRIGLLALCDAPPLRLSRSISQFRRETDN